MFYIKKFQIGKTKTAGPTAVGPTICGELHFSDDVHQNQRQQDKGGHQGQGEEQIECSEAGIRLARRRAVTTGL